MEDESGNGVPVDTQALSDLFRLYRGIECVVLNACYSAAQAKAIAEQVQYVIGTTDSVADDSAIRFSEVFYGSICNGHGFEDSYNVALAQLGTEGLLHDFQSVSYILRKTRILSPCSTEEVVPETNIVSGVAGDDFIGNVYLVTGGGIEKRYWPSQDGQVKPDTSRKWSGKVHVGSNRAEATISLLRLDASASEYIEFYRQYASSVKWPGLTLANFHFDVLDTITVKINLMPLRQRLVGLYSEFKGADEPTGRIITISLSGAWGISLECSFKGKVEWTSTVMMDEGDPNVGKGVYTLADSRIGHHHIIYNPVDKSIRVDGYVFPDSVGRKWDNTNTLKRI